jgi:hypothetical protein
MSKKKSTDALLLAIQKCRAFIGANQIAVMVEACRGEEGEFFREQFFELADLFESMPRTYWTDGQGDAATVHLHYFIGASDFFIIERDIDHAQEQAFGLADLYGDGGELGYVSILELIRNGVELDLHWTPRTLAEVKAERERRALQ